MMTQDSINNGIRDVTTSIKKFDLSMVKRKLMEPSPEGRGWTQEQADEAEKWYRRYLTLIAKYPDVVQVPNASIDAFWHQHILDTHKYAEDCSAIFGFFLHHYPYFGLNGTEDATARDRAFDETNRLYRAEFGEDCLQMKTFTVTSGSGCGDKGSGTGCKQGCSRGR